MTLSGFNGGGRRRVLQPVILTVTETVTEREGSVEEEIDRRCGHELLQGRLFSCIYLSLRSRATSLRVVHHDYSPLYFHVPYVHGLLSFRDSFFSFFVSDRMLCCFHLLNQVSQNLQIELLVSHAHVISADSAKEEDDKHSFYSQSLRFLSLSTEVLTVMKGKISFITFVYYDCRNSGFVILDFVKSQLHHVDGLKTVRGLDGRFRRKKTSSNRSPHRSKSDGKLVTKT
ncbi:hypothetical protein HID58_038056 [Brassica napus]|uniref:Uncharacterized protein n=1 Tax=Brassica napus TaxID=3708 RepID=A0ABQ8BN24_BRANA|nr:hypothetical protein HID58_038056 [Brassica napus]